LEENSLAVVWSSADAEVAQNVVLIYARNAKKSGWFDNVELIIWGPSGKLLLKDEVLRIELAAAMDDGVRVKACKWCSDRYEISSQLAELGIEVEYMGVPLTDALKSKSCKVLTF
jgi:hypothetical protein